MASNEELRNEENINRLLSERQGISAELVNDVQDYTNALQKQLSLLKYERSERKQIASAIVELNRIAQKNYTLTTNEIGSLKTIKNLQKDISALAARKTQLERLAASDLGTSAKAQKYIKDALKNIIPAYKEVTAELKEQLRLSGEISNSTGVRIFEGLNRVIKSIPGLKGISEPFEKAAAAVRQQAIINSKLKGISLETGKGLKKEAVERLGLTEQLTIREGKYQGRLLTGGAALRKIEKEGLLEGVKKQSELLTGALLLGKAMVNAFGPLALLGKGVQAFLELNKASVEYQRATGQNIAIQASLNDRLITSVDYIRQAVELTDQLGRSANSVFDSGTIAAAAELQKTLGLSATQAGSLATITQATGKNLDQAAASIVDQVKGFNSLNRVAVAPGKIIKDIANTSKSITLSFGESTEELSQAASQASRLGMNLEDVDRIASSLLDFESSIEKELEAQLLTGNQINMAKAMELALNNDLAGLGEELFKNSVDIHKFGKMNRIEQEAQAAALGMTREQLARTAYLRAIDSKMTEKQAADAADVRLEDMKRVDVQNQLTTSINKMAQAIAGPLESFASLVSHAWVMKGIIGSIIVMMGANMVNSIGGAIGQLGKFLKVLRAIRLTTLQTAIASAWKAAFSGPGALITGGIAGLAIGAGLTAAIMSSVSKKGDDIMSPGYGKRTLFGPEGAIALNNKDTVIAGTNLFSQSTSNQPQVPSIAPQTTVVPQTTVAPPQSLSFEPLVNEIKQMRQEMTALLSKIAAKDTKVVMDGYEVGKAVSLASVGQ